jgi:hypothetical protein
MVPQLMRHHWLEIVFRSYGGDDDDDHCLHRLNFRGKLVPKMMFAGDN